MVRPIAHSTDDKGRRVEIIGGAYKGLFGWVHLSANTFSNKAWIIVEAGHSGEEKTHLLLKTNFTSVMREVAAEAPSTFEHALLKEHSDIKGDMQNLAKKLATFMNYDPSEGRNMMAIFWKMWSDERKHIVGSNRLANVRVVTSWATNPNNPNNPNRRVEVVATQEEREASRAREQARAEEQARVEHHAALQRQQEQARLVAQAVVAADEEERRARARAAAEARAQERRAQAAAKEEERRTQAAAKERRARAAAEEEERRARALVAEEEERRAVAAQEQATAEEQALAQATAELEAPAIVGTRVDILDWQNRFTPRTIPTAEVTLDDMSIGSRLPDFESLFATRLVSDEESDGQVRTNRAGANSTRMVSDDEQSDGQARASLAHTNTAFMSLSQRARKIL